MMDIREFATHAGVLVSHGLKRGGDFDARTEQAYQAIYSDIDGALPAFRDLLAELGLVGVQSPARKNLSIMPTDANSIFAMKLSEIRRSIGNSSEADLKSDILGFFMLCTVASFYPSRESISYGSVNKVVENDVFAMVARMVDFGMEFHDDPKMLTLASEVNKMQDRDEGTRNRSSFRSYYVKASLGVLSESKLVSSSKENGEEVFYATARLRDICTERLSTESLHMAEILEKFYSRDEVAFDV